MTLQPNKDKTLIQTEGETWRKQMLLSHAHVNMLEEWEWTKDKDKETWWDE